MLSRLATVSKTTASRGVCAAMQGRSSLSTDIRGRWPQGVDAKGKVEFSVVYTDKALSHMSDYFGDVMRDLSRVIKKAYNANTVALIPGSGSYAMEAVARQFGTDKDVMVLRNGYFSFRWSHIFDACNIPKSVNILKAQRQDDSAQPQFNTTPIEEVVAAIHDTKPEVVFMPHIETSTSIHLPDTYIRQVADAVHAHGGLLVLDGIAAGFNWADMEKVGADVMINAPQKSWSAVASVGMVMMSPNGRAALDNTTSTSMALDLKQWVNMMETYENGGMAYYCTMPTDGIAQFRDMALELEEYGFSKLMQQQWDLGIACRKIMEEKGCKPVSIPGFQSQGVSVFYVDDHAEVFKNYGAAGAQVAGNVPFMLDEPEGNGVVRFGLFGLEKVKDMDRTIAAFQDAADAVFDKK